MKVLIRKNYSELKKDFRLLFPLDSVTDKLTEQRGVGCSSGICGVSMSIENR